MDDQVDSFSTELRLGEPDPREGQGLFSRLLEIQQLISQDAPLQRVLDAITAGAGKLLGDSVVGLRMVDPDDAEYAALVASSGLNEEMRRRLKRSHISQGAGGRAIRENRLVIIEEYSRSPDAITPLAGEGLQAAMAAPVYDEGRVVGSLVVASYEPGRTYSRDEQEVLLAFARHVGLALAYARSLEAMREAHRTKDMFVAVTSHGLKTPLTAILGTLIILEKHHERLSRDDRDRMIVSARARSQELSTMIDRLLEGFRVELALVNREESLPALIEESILGFAQARNVAVSEVPETSVVTDTDAVKQTLGILLENALSHSPPGSPIRIDVTAKQDDVAISVVNEGSLPESDVEQLFEPFHRGARSATAGVGLGLYIARKLAHAIGGTIEVGTADAVVRFTLRFPRLAE